jgi:hypothetical protein
MHYHFERLLRILKGTKPNSFVFSGITLDNMYKRFLIFLLLFHGEYRITKQCFSSESMRKTNLCPFSHGPFFVKEGVTRVDKIFPIMDPLLSAFS